MFHEFTGFLILFRHLMAIKVRSVDCQLGTPVSARRFLRAATVPGGLPASRAPVLAGGGDGRKALCQGLQLALGWHFGREMRR